MNLPKLLIGWRPRTFVLSIVSGAIAGMGTTLLLILTNDFLRHVVSNLKILEFAGVCLVVFTAGIAAQATLVRLTQQTVFDMRLAMAERILGADLHFLELQKSARLTSMLTEDIAVVAHAMQGFPIFIINLAVIVACGLYLAWQSGVLFSVFLGFGLLGVLVYSAITTRALYHVERARDQQDQLFFALDGLVNGVKELKLNPYRGRHFLARELAGAAGGYRDANVAGLTRYAVAGNLGRLLFFIAIAIQMLVSERLGRQDALSAYILVSLFLASPLDAVLTWLPAFSRAEVALKKINSCGVSLEQSREKAVAVPPTPTAPPTLELQQVAHSHATGSPEDFSVGPLNLRFRPGEVIFIVGGNGAGKSTFAKLLTGLYSAQSGQILLNEQPVAAEDLSWYRSHFAAVFADAYLFADFSHILRAGLDSDARSYLERFYLHRKVEIAHGRFSTLELSQGQRKRLALLVALLEDKPIYVFDEWAAEQDPASKEWFYVSLLHELKRRGKLVFVITHDQRYFQHADRTITMDAGQIVRDEWRDKEVSHDRSRAADAPSCAL